MRSLVLSRFRPDRPSGGAALRNCQNINGLRALGRVDVVSIGRDQYTGPIEGIDHWAAFSRTGRPVLARFKSKLRVGLGQAHPEVESYWHPDAAAAIAAHSPYDVAVIEELSLARYFPILRQYAKRVVFDAHNVEASLRRTVNEQKTGDDKLFNVLLAEEARIAELADVIWTCSNTDLEQFIDAYNPSGSVFVVPNAVNLIDYEMPDDKGLAEGRVINLLYPGTFTYYPNEDAALTLIKDVLPQLRDLDARVAITLAGRGPTTAMTEAATDQPEVSITGGVESMRPYMEQADMLVLPINIGSGTRLKILEAFAARRPVITTRKGAEGVDAQDGVHLLYAETPREMAQAVLRVHHDRALRAELCAAAFDLVRQRYSWEAAAHAIATSLDQTCITQKLVS